MGEGDGVFGEDDRVVRVDRRHMMIALVVFWGTGRKGERAPSFFLFFGVHP